MFEISRLGYTLKYIAPLL